MRNALFSTVLGVALIASAPMALRADDHPKRYYDKSHKDYHEWNANEDAAYRRWQSEQHGAHHEWAKASKAEQNRYWQWRHDHPDSH